MTLKTLAAYRSAISTELRHHRGGWAVLSIVVAGTRLEFRFGRGDLISSSDRYQQLDERDSREFEQVPGRVVVAIRAGDPERAWFTELQTASDRSANVDRKPPLACSKRYEGRLCDGQFDDHDHGAGLGQYGWIYAPVTPVI